MHVIATAGHVDHGKSTLVKALTGSDPDRLEEERRRGLSIQLGYCWTSLPGAGEVAFVDVPGHERFVSTMLAGIGPVPAVLLVVAADDPWMPQAAEHLAALDALGVRHGVVAVTRSDLADPAPAAERAAYEVGRTSLRGRRSCRSAPGPGRASTTLRDHLVATWSAACRRRTPAADVRLWVDRRFTVKGAGTVVTGTLPAGTLARGDTAQHRRGRPAGAGAGRAVARRPVASATGVARVALNVTGDDLDDLDRGSVLVTPGAYLAGGVVDVRVTGAIDRLPEGPLLHVGATATAVHVRPLGGDAVRLVLDTPLPLRVGDRALLRDPGSREVWGVRVLDPLPPSLRRRGAGARRAKELAGVSGEPDLASEVERRGVVEVPTLRRLGVPASPVPSSVVAAGGWLMSADRAEQAADELPAVVAAHDRAHPLDPGLPLAVVAERVGLPSPDLVAAVVRPPAAARGRAGAGRVGHRPSAGPGAGADGARRGAGRGAVRRADRRPAPRARPGHATDRRGREGGPAAPARSGHRAAARRGRGGRGVAA